MSTLGDKGAKAREELNGEGATSQLLLITLPCVQRYITFEAHSATLQKGGTTLGIPKVLCINCEETRWVKDKGKT